MSYEIDHLFGNDITRGPSGALAVVYGTIQGEQRVYRRLMTNPGTYIWHPTYGAGLPQFVGKLRRAGEIESIIRVQLALEPIVAQQPTPVVVISDIEGGVLFIDIAYIDAITKQVASVAFEVA